MHVNVSVQFAIFYIHILYLKLTQLVYLKVTL